MFALMPFALRIVNDGRPVEVDEIVGDFWTVEIVSPDPDAKAPDATLRVGLTADMAKTLPAGDAIIQLVGSLAILAWVDWTLLAGAVVLLPVVYLTHRSRINNVRPQFRVIRKQREQIDASAIESFAGMRVVRAFSRQRRETARFTTKNNLMARQELYAWWWIRRLS
jgi:ABC-type multidrug transport system fused ATPase/permease subunit